MTTDEKREKLLHMVRDDFEATIYFAAAEDDCIDALWEKWRKHDMRIQAADALIVLSFLGLAMLLLEVL